MSGLLIANGRYSVQTGSSIFKKEVICSQFKSSRVLILGVVRSLCSHNVLSSLSLVSTFLCVDFSLREGLHIWRQENVQQLQTFISPSSAVTVENFSFPVIPEKGLELALIGLTFSCTHPRTAPCGVGD